MKKTLSVLILSVLLVLSLTAGVLAASTFTPSVTAKPAPEVVKIADAAGNPVSGLIFDSNGNEIEGISEADITVTPVSDAENSDDEIKTDLLAAYEEIRGAETVADLGVDFSSAFTESGSNLNADELVVRDLVDVSLAEEKLSQLASTGGYIQLIFDMGAKPDEEVAVMTRSGGEWQIVAPADIKNNGDGSVTVKFRQFCPVAFLVASDAAPVVDPTPVTPEKKSNSGVLWAAGGGLAVLGGAAAVIAGKKRKA